MPVLISGASSAGVTKAVLAQKRPFLNLLFLQQIVQRIASCWGTSSAESPVRQSTWMALVVFRLPCGYLLIPLFQPAQSLLRIAQPHICFQVASALCTSNFYHEVFPSSLGDTGREVGMHPTSTCCRCFVLSNPKRHPTSFIQCHQRSFGIWASMCYDANQADKVETCELCSTITANLLENTFLTTTPVWAKCPASKNGESFRLGCCCPWWNEPSCKSQKHKGKPCEAHEAG